MRWGRTANASQIRLTWNQRSDDVSPKIAAPSSTWTSTQRRTCSHQGCSTSRTCIKSRPECDISEALPYRSVLVTGAGGYIGHQLIEALAADRRQLRTIVATDVRLPAETQRVGGVEYGDADIRTAD